MKKKGLLLTGGVALVAVTLAVGSYIFNDKVEEAAIEATEGKPASESEKNADVGEVALTAEEKAAVAEEELGDAGGTENGYGVSTTPFSNNSIDIFGGIHQGSYLFSSLTNSVVYAADKYNENNYPRVSPNNNQLGLSPTNTNVIAQPSIQQPSSGTNTGGATNTGKQPVDNSNTGSEQKPLNEIRQKYVQEFQQMSFQYNWAIDSLISEAENDVFYNGMKNVDKTYYRSQASALESEADAAFEKKYSELKTELKRNGHSETALQEMRSTYEGQKASKRQELEARASGL